MKNSKGKKIIIKKTLNLRVATQEQIHSLAKLKSLSLRKAVIEVLSDCRYNSRMKRKGINLK